MHGLERDTKLINDLATWAGKKPSRMATDLGMAATTLARPASGKATTRLGRSTLDALRAEYPDFPGWSAPLEIGSEPDQAPTRSTEAGEDVVEITALDLSLSMGPGTLIEEFVESEPVKMSLNLVQSITRTPSDRLRLVRGIGDSMEPTLRSSDRVMVDINEKQLTRISGIYWINREGAHGIKRLRPAAKGRVAIISDNPIEGNDEVDADDLRIEGRVIWFAREL